MPKLEITIDERVPGKFDAYPKKVRPKMNALRKLILSTAKELDAVTKIEETLKWGEPSYLTKKGSTVRIDWKTKSPNQYAIYFKCTSSLVLTFKELYGDLFKYENNRAILFSFDDKIPTKELKHCISMALQYHSLKHLPLLGA